MLNMSKFFSILVVYTCHGSQFREVESIGLEEAIFIY